MVAAFVCSLVAVFVSLLALRASRERFARSKLRRDIDVAAMELVDLRDLYTNLLSSHKKLSQRQTMRDRRAKKDLEETPEEWKKRKRAELAISKLGVKN